jgi:hypothetical protein
MPVIGTMDSATILLGVGIGSMTGLVGMALYWSNQRALEKMRQESLNYRAELRSGGGAAPYNQASEQDPITAILTLVQQNPELLKQFTAMMGNQQNQQGQLPPVQ